MDSLSDLPNGGAGVPPHLEPEPGMPAEAPLAMPEQRIDHFDPASRRAFVNPERSRTRLWPRIFVLGGAALLIAAAVYEMTNVLLIGGMTIVEWIVLFFFTLNFAWIALAFTGALGGFARLVRRRRRKPRLSSAPIAGRTAMLMPTYNESPERVFAAVEAMASGLAEAYPDAPIDWFILSDTTSPSIILAEEAALIAIRSRVGSEPRIYYRRRRLNHARKAGNIADFCKRWGGAYDYLIVLDADSLVEPSVILELIRRMEADPDAGLIQTVPALVNGRTLLARLQQFAGRVYGPVIAAGLGWWSGSEGNYWGHNAIIRRKAFTEAAGLPVLSGKPPFGGHILSHDFVEAALIRRAGWTVRLADDLEGSYEEGPPSIVDLAVRDRRWCQGNLQHSRLLTAAGFHWNSRLHLLTGIMSYVASPLWLLLIIAGLALSLQAQYVRPEYFGDSFQLFPTWPAIDPERALRLLGITALVLFGPKLLGLSLLLTDRRARTASGGTWNVFASFLVEFVISMLIAPIMMLIQSGMVSSILRGKDSGWNPQRRDDGRIGLRELFVRHRWHMAGGVALAVAAELISPVMLAWLLPAIAGLVFAMPLSALTASPIVGDIVRRDGLLRTPEEAFIPPIETAARAHRPIYREIAASGSDVIPLLRDERRRRVHLALIDRHSAERARGHVDPVEVIAAAKIAQARSVEEALSFLDPREQATALATPELCERLAALPVTLRAAS